jgi:hypothetical protein
MLNKFSLLLICILASMSAVKIANIQIVELFMIVMLFIYLLNFLIKGKYNLHYKLKGLVEQYFLLFLFLLLLTGINLRQEFFIPPNIANSLLQRPVIISLARIIQLLLAMIFSVIIAKTLYRDKNLLYFFINAYVVVGTMNAIYGIISYFLLPLFNINIGGAYLSGGFQLRALGFFKEGGPFGLYLVTVIVVTLFRKYSLKKGNNYLNYILLSIQTLGIILAQSKASLVAIFILIFIYFIEKISFRSLMYTILFLFSFKIYSYTDIGRKDINMFKSYVAMATLAYNKPEYVPTSINLMGGRASGIYLVPRMIIMNPIFGIGIGNYSLVRNDPKYLKGLPVYYSWDQHSLGLIGYLPEFGIPLFLLFIYLLFKPVYWSLKIKPRGLIFVLASTQLVIHIVGAQITFLYPWLVSAICMGYIHGGTQNFYRSLANKPSLSH